MCQIEKQNRMSHKMEQHLSTKRVLELLHMDIMGLMHIESSRGKRYAFVCVDDYSRFSRIKFLREKFGTCNAFKILFLKLIREKNRQLKKAIRIRSDHGKEFENSLFTKFCNKHEIDHEFFAPKTPQQNGMEEGKNRALREMDWVMIKEKNVPVKFWAEVLNTTCYTLNKVY